jgi:hypothetical protein
MSDINIDFPIWVFVGLILAYALPVTTALLAPLVFARVFGGRRGTGRGGTIVGSRHRHPGARAAVADRGRWLGMVRNRLAGRLAGVSSSTDKSTARRRIPGIIGG